MFKLVTWCFLLYFLMWYVYDFINYNRRPTALQDRTRDSDDDDYQDRDYDVAALANNLSQAFRYSIYENDDSEEVCRKWIILLNFFFFLSLSVCISVSFFLSGLIWFISCWSSWLQGHGALERDDEVILYSATFLINVLNSLHIMDENLKGDYTYIKIFEWKNVWGTKILDNLSIL